jgi:hypothetical protein
LHLESNPPQVPLQPGRPIVGSFDPDVREPDGDRVARRIPRDERAHEALHPDPLGIPTLDTSADGRRWTGRGARRKRSRDDWHVLGVHPVLDWSVPVAFAPAEQLVGVGADLGESPGLVNDPEHHATRVALVFAACVEGHDLAIRP